jgi:hypothetical protein
MQASTPRNNAASACRLMQREFEAFQAWIVASMERASRKRFSIADHRTTELNVNK